MEITVTDLSGVKKKIAVAVDQERIHGEMEKALKKYRKKARVKGFRPGKVPVSMVKSLYDEQMRVEVMEALVQSSYLEALNEKNIVPLAFPQVENLSFGENNDYLSYEATVEVKPEFEIDGYLGLELERYPAEVTDQEIDEGMESLRQAYAEYVPVEDRPSREGDTLVIDFSGKIDGEAFPGGSASGYTVELGSGTFIPDLENQLPGLPLDETRDIEVTFPEDYPKAELAGKPAVFTVTVKEIKEKTLPEITDDFAADVSAGEITTVAELRGKIAEGARSRKEEMAKRKTVDAMLTKLRAMVDFEIPECLVENEQQAMLQAMKSRYLAQGLEQGMVEQMVDANQDKVKEDAVETVKNTLILERLAELEEITATQEEISKQLHNLIYQSGRDPRSLSEHYKGREAELEENLRTQVAMDKLIARLLDNGIYKNPEEVKEES
ncbi:MAG: trigger factor [Deltaproteobacteria bacterium]|nr:trigger factor [Candidatus Anaeroferrophillus wilburensis]MBN2890087.1 trigger factor [Deltaproteobacteria bacterium]